MKINSKMIALFAGALFCVAGVLTAQANTLVTFSVDMTTNNVLGTFTPGVDTVAARGTFNGYGTLNLVQDTSQLPELIYTNTANDTSDADNGTLQYKYWDSNAGVPNGGWEATADGQNRAAKLLSGGASLVLPTPFFADAGGPVSTTINFQVDVAQQVNLGNFTPGTSSVEVRGTFNSWTGGATTLTDAGHQPGEPDHTLWTGSATYTASPGAAQAFKYVIQPGTVWDGPSAANQDGGQNRYYAAVSQTLPLVNFADLTYVALTCTNVFTLDMTAPIAFDAGFIPGSVTLNGAFNGWGAAVPMIPTGYNPNIFTSSVPVFYGQGQTYEFQFRYQNGGGTVYDHLNGENGGGGNRSLTEPNQNNYNPPTIVFNDAPYSDYLSAPENVTFNLLMTTSDVGTGGTPTWSPGTAMFVNGPWPNWLGWDPISLSGQVLNETPIDGSSSSYTGTFTIPRGVLASLTYKYSMGGADNEAAQDHNHNRVIRQTATGSYAFPQDRWGTQYVEPSFGQLKAGSDPGLTVPISWLGRPGCQLQINSDLASGSWVSLPETDGTNFTAGVASTNGVISVTNYPVTGGSLFFRLIKQ